MHTKKQSKLMDNFPFIEEKKSFKEWLKEHQSGLYLTLIFHLLILLFLTVQGIRGRLNGENVFVFDFSKQEMKEAQKQQEIKEQKQKEEVEREVNDMIRKALNTSRETPRNVAVNTADLKDNKLKVTNETKSILDEAQELQARLDATRQKVQDMQGVDDVPVRNALEKDKESKTKEVYKGPSVLSYTLEGRRAINLPVPVYKCPGGGDVTVTIEVNQQGYVTDVVIHKNASTDDDCLHRAAKDAAMRSRFNIDINASNKQKGEIVYRFIPQ